MHTLHEIWDVFRTQIIVGLVLSVFTSVFAYMLFDTEPPYTYDATRSFIEPDRASGGDELTANWKVKVNRFCPGTMQRQLFDPKTGAIISTYDAVPMAPAGFVGPDGYLRRNFMLPRAISKGRTGYRVNLCFACNPLQKQYPICTVTPDLFFEVR